MENNQKEVYFVEYCGTCKHFAKNGDEDPCDECLNTPWRYDSHKPEKYEEK